MDKPHQVPSTGLLTEEYEAGIRQFMGLATNQDTALQTGKMICPCANCKNRRTFEIKKIWSHLFNNGFMSGYKIWYTHGEDDSMVNFACSSHQYAGDKLGERTPELENLGSVQIVNDVWREHIPAFVEDGHRVEEPNLEARRFFDMLDAAKLPLYVGCREGVSPLSTASRLMTINSDHNLSEECVDDIAAFVKGILPEDNLAPASFYEIHKLVKGLGLPYQMIDVCENNCMIYWRADSDLLHCRFCHYPRYKETGGRVRIPFRRMWYLPLTERLKRLYQSERTAGPMRWHAEHTSEGKIAHPSDADAWKYFKNVYPWFASENRNVYLGLSTYGFNAFGKHGRQYSLWPVIVTPYNLPPSLCMKREFLFLMILVPGPEHPKKSLDIFLQPLIYELQQLWEHGVETYDVSCQQSFMMHVVLMWTISDFPAYGMLSGWSTHGRLACPHCQDSTYAFQLKNGRKMCWFDCHRRFLPMDHPYRNNTTLFTKNKQVYEGPPPEVDGVSMLYQFRDYGAERTVDCGGNGHHPVDGVGEMHNWNKKSIFWDLPYWNDHLLRHNLDVMHIEKNFFDNIMNTILNVKGKTKDNLNSRLDLATICARKALHVNAKGKAPIPCFRLDAPSKQEFFNWIVHSVKFSDGYASNLRNCVDSREERFSGMKSHDCHVLMQRLLPFAVEGLLPRHVHEAIAGIASFFRDICTRSLTVDGIRNLKEQIPVILCNLEKIFPPSFFDVMEHLPIHLPREATLGGPVQYRWMYPFGRYMFHLKKKVKNLSRVEGSIVAQNIIEETSNFGSYYFPSAVQTKSRRPDRNDDGGVRSYYPAYVPSIFTEIGRLSGKGKKRRRLTNEERDHLQYYILTNLDEISEYERIYEAQVRYEYPHLTEEEITALKEQEFVDWMHYYVTTLTKEGQSFPTWLQELVHRPLSVATPHKMYFTRGYGFKIYEEGTTRTTSNYGISSASDDLVYYGVLREILEIQYPGMLGMKCVVFYCDWYNPIEGYGVRHNQFGVTAVHSDRRLQKFDPFVLASKADQVCYIRYPHVTSSTDSWLTVTSIYPRGRIDGVSDHDPMQQNELRVLGSIPSSLEVDLVVDFTGFGDNVVFDDLDDERDEFEEALDSMGSSDYSSDSE